MPLRFQIRRPIADTQLADTRPLRRSILALGALLPLLAAPPLAAQTPVQTFYVPIYEDQFATELLALEEGSHGPVTATESVISIASAFQETIVFYDHVEDGYEFDLGAPTQESTEVWALGAGQVLNLRASIPTVAEDAETTYGGGDRIGATQAVSVSRAAWDGGLGADIGIALELFPTTEWGTDFLVPVGENVPSDELFARTTLFVMAQGATEVQVQVPGSAGEAFDLAAGSSLALTGVRLGTRVQADVPVQLHLVAGDPAAESPFEMRGFTLPPYADWSTSYLMPVGTSELEDDRTTVWLFNPSPANLPVVFDSQGTTHDAVLEVPPASVVPFDMPVGLGGSFHSVGGAFSAIATINAAPDNHDGGGVGPDNAVSDWGFALTPAHRLGSMALAGWAPGDGNPVPGASSSPLWVTSLFDTSLYVSWDGDLVPETVLELSAFEALRLVDFTDHDQSGTRVFTLDDFGDGAPVLAMAWGEAPDQADVFGAALDLGKVVPAAANLAVSKYVFLTLDLDGNGFAGPGDTLSYWVVIVNGGPSTASQITLVDSLPESVSYVPRSTFVQGSIAYPQGDVTDDEPFGGQTPFPLDQRPFWLGDLPPGELMFVVFEVTVDDEVPATVTALTNLVSVDASAMPTVRAESRTPVFQAEIELQKTVYAGHSGGAQCPGQEFVFSPLGGPLTFCFEITNRGGVALQIDFEDSLLGIGLEDLVSVELGSADLSPLAPGQSRTYFAEALADEAWFDEEEVFNLARVTGQPVDQNGQPVTGSPAVSSEDTAAVALIRYELLIEKWTAGSNDDGAPGPLVPAGSVVSHSYMVFNLSSLPVGDISISDSDPSIVIDCPELGSDTVLDPGEFISCSATGVAIPGQYESTATAIGIAEDGTEVEGSDSSHYFGLAASIDLEITPEGQLVAPGGTATVSLTITNDGNTRLFDVTAASSHVEGCGRALGELEVGQSVSFACETPALFESASFSVSASGEAALVAAASDTAVAFVEVVPEIVDSIEGVRGKGYWKTHCEPSTRGNGNAKGSSGPFAIDFLPVSVGSLTVTSCKEATNLLDQRDLTGQKKAQDPAYALAAHLTAAKLNYAAGATRCLGVSVAIATADGLLASAGFSGLGTHDALDRDTAGALVSSLERYNEGDVGACAKVGR